MVQLLINTKKTLSKKVLELQQLMEARTAKKKKKKRCVCGARTSALKHLIITY